MSRTPFRRSNGINSLVAADETARDTARMIRPFQNIMNFLDGNPLSLN
jgi:hypothetical protein